MAGALPRASRRLLLPCHPLSPHLDLVEEGREELPRGLELVVADEEAAVSVDGVQDEPLVGVRQAHAPVLVVVDEVEPRGAQPHAQPRELVVDAHVDLLVRLDLDDQLVCVLVELRVLGLEEVPGHVAELDADLPHPPDQGLARAHQDGHAVPAGVVDEHDHGSERGRRARGRHRVVVQVAWQALARHSLVLPQDDVLQADGADGAEDLDLLVAHVLCPQRDRRLHRKQRQDLQEVVLDDVPEDAVLVVVPPPPLGAEVLGEGDLHVADVLSAPQGLEDQVAEAQRRQVLHQLLAQVVVDPEDLVLPQHLLHPPVELLVAREVTAEGLFHDHPRPPRGGGGLARQALTAGQEDGGRQREVEESVGPLAPLLQLPQLAVQLREILDRVVLPADVVHALQELLHLGPAVGPRVHAAGER